MKNTHIFMLCIDHWLPVLLVNLFKFGTIAPLCTFIFLQRVFVMCAFVRVSAGAATAVQKTSHISLLFLNQQQEHWVSFVGCSSFRSGK